MPSNASTPTHACHPGNEIWRYPGSFPRNSERWVELGGWCAHVRGWVGRVWAQDGRREIVTVCSWNRVRRRGALTFEHRQWGEGRVCWLFTDEGC